MYTFVRRLHRSKCRGWPTHVLAPELSNLGLRRVCTNVCLFDGAAKVYTSVEVAKCADATRIAKTQAFVLELPKHENVSELRKQICVCLRAAHILACAGVAQTSAFVPELYAYALGRPQTI
jgi:hypothetical protein